MKYKLFYSQISFKYCIKNSRIFNHIPLTIYNIITVLKLPDTMKSSTLYSEYL